MTITTLPAHLLKDWHSNDPQRMIAALRSVGVSEERIDRWCELCEREYVRLDGAYPGPANWWKTEDIGSGSMFDHALPYLRCMFGSEFAGEWEECKRCLMQADDGKMYSSGYHRYKDFDDGRPNFSDTAPCSQCRGLGVVRATVGPGRFDADYLPGAVEYRLCIPLIDPRWRTSTVMDLAQRARGDTERMKKELHDCGIKDDKAVTAYMHACIKDKYGPKLDLLPILADALEDAGCDNAELLAHCRSGGPHVPGECWVLNLLR